MEFEIKEPVLIVGVGGAACKLAIKAKSSLNSECLLISHDQKDLDSSHSRILVNTNPVLNPSSYLIRGVSYGVLDNLKEKLANYSTIIMIANLAGKSGAALAPIVSQAGRELGKNVLSLGIMPFKFEKDRIFFSGVSLKRMKANSDCTIIVDNDALLDSNPDLTPDSCNNITNAAVLEIISSLKSSSLPRETNILSTSKDVSDVQISLRDSIKMLYEDAPPNSVKSAMLYVMGGNKVSVGVLNSMVNTISGIFNDDSTRVSLSVVAAENSKVILLTSVDGETRFDRYDPLGFIPQQNMLDWDDPDCSIKLELDLKQLE